MPLSDHEQRMLDQIESALYAEDPKFASSVRGGNLRAPSARRRLQGAVLFLVGLGLLVAGVPFYANVNHAFLIVSVIGFVIMFGGVVFAITGPRVAGAREGNAPEQGSARQKRAKGNNSFSSRMEERFRRRFEE
ncbi:hypothetical protein MMAD_34340 [Mycolicibacterium madagascariense]|uniref:DUF3040 domain-containing protein n=1 Tax=Mycolicibacterium madagascariense TaxID=212765 RepID=A0A7I7XIV8_9MYCO|nr:DUF3040 domain-containing protein [Mycolicibacterium madagascariense]MCV7015922.1 DUF3040 domain-containing protein [Mycolicibacterium madagascariense]BBZ29139.1 hypothetical protein MMAD_34340 [Mycolicibacterium madagascariense]